MTIVGRAVTDQATVSIYITITLRFPTHIFILVFLLFVKKISAFPAIWGISSANANRKSDMLPAHEAQAELLQFRSSVQF